MKTKKEKKIEKVRRVYRLRAGEGTYLVVNRWITRPPTQCSKDVIELEIRSKTGRQSTFMQDWEAEHVAVGLMLAVIEKHSK